MRISPIAPFGSLLKGERPQKKSGRKLNRAANEGYLSLVRRCGCLSCDTDPAREAAHLRMSGPGKPITGMGTKPPDRYALPLCTVCHTKGRTAQHRVGELAFWSRLGIDPFSLCVRLFTASPNIEAMRAVIFAAREGRK